MKNKKIIFMLVVITIIMTGCGGKSNSGNGKRDNDASKQTDEITTEQLTEEKEPLDLTGLWLSEKNEDAYMVATIRDDGKIGVFWIIGGNEEEPVIYWIGTYDEPDTAGDEYEWVSETTYNGEELLASSLETKKFSYNNDEISFEVTVSGETGIVSMKRGDWDDSKISASLFSDDKDDESEFKEIEIKDSGWCVNDGYLFHYVTLYNPNETIAVDYAGYRIVARDEKGELLGSTEEGAGRIYPKQEFTFGCQAFSVDETPANVDFSMMTIKDYNKINASVDDFSKLEIVNDSLRSDKIVGEIYNPNDFDIDSAWITVVCKDVSGKIVKIESTFVDDIKSKENTPFSISVYNMSNVDSIESFAEQW